MNQKTSPTPQPGHAKRGMAELRAIQAAVPAVFDYKRLSYRHRFLDRGLSDRTVESLIIGGVDYPEQLLKMSEAAIFRIAGIGKVSLSEIMQYKQKF
jgi:DNA-directed RNA polymerase alpha subunit